MAADERALDIFRILPDGSPLLVETVKGRAEARKRVAQLIAETPGTYCVYDPRTDKFIDIFARPA